MRNAGMRSVILNMLLLVSSVTYAQDTLYNRGGLVLTDNHNYKDSTVSFGHKIDDLLKTKRKNKSRIRRMAVNRFGAGYDTSLAKEGRFNYIKQGIDIVPEYQDELNFMAMHLRTQNSKETLNNYPLQKLTAQEVIRLLGKPYRILMGDVGLDCFIYLTGKTKIIFYFHYKTDDCSQKPHCNEIVEEISIYYNRKGAEL